MRKLILIAAAMVLVSATAQAGDSRSLSTGLTTNAPGNPPATNDQTLQADNDTTTTTLPSQAETPRYSPPPAETPPLAEPTRNTSETPRYTARPAPVDNAPPQVTTTPSTARHEPASDTTSRPERAHHAHAARQHHRGGTYWTAGRIIAELHRYGIDW